MVNTFTVGHKGTAMNWCSVFTKISSLRKGMGGQNKTTSACWACKKSPKGTWKPLALVHVHVHVRVCMQGGQRVLKQSPTPLSVFRVSTGGTELAVSHEVPRGLCCHFPRSTEEREGLSQGSPRPTSNQIHGDFAQKNDQVRALLPLFW